MVTPTRRGASRATPSSASGIKFANTMMMSNETILVEDEIPIDPALLEEEMNLQEDMDAEGEVDDGVGYYMPVSVEYGNSDTPDRGLLLPGRNGAILCFPSSSRVCSRVGRVVFLETVPATHGLRTRFTIGYVSNIANFQQRSTYKAEAWTT